jgi:hypothetical protein
VGVFVAPDTKSEPGPFTACTGAAQSSAARSSTFLHFETFDQELILESPTFSSVER